MKKSYFISCIILCLSLTAFSKSKVDIVKTNGIKVIVDDTDSTKYNEYIKKAMSKYWKFSDFSFITQSEYNDFTGKETDFVLGLMEITILVDNYVYCDDGTFLISTNKHKHVAKKNNRINLKDITTYDLISKTILSNNLELEALIYSIVREQNLYFSDLYNGSKAKDQSVNYKSLKKSYEEDNSLPIYFLESDFVIGKEYLTKVDNKNIQLVSREKLFNALMNGESVLIYLYQVFNEGHSNKKLIHAETGKVFFNITNGKTNDKATLKDVLKNL